MLKNHVEKLADAEQKFESGELVKLSIDDAEITDIVDSNSLTYVALNLNKTSFL